MPAVYPSSQNVFIRDHDASNKMVIDFARNVKDFALNQYAQIVPVKKTAGYYMHMTIEEAGRILHSDLRNFRWPDGQPAPEGAEGTESFQFLAFETARMAYAFQLGDLTIDQATWNILAQHSSIKSRQAMTARTQLVVTSATTTGNYDASHVIDIPALAGNSGKWSESTTARQDIKRSLFTAAERILDDTLAAVNAEDFILVISSGLAAEIAQCQELVDYIKGSPEAYAQVRGELPNRNKFYGLPEVLYGFKLVVEATRKLTSKKGATAARTSVLPKATPFLCARPGGLVGVAEAPNFSTHVLFAQEEMTVETLRDAPNRRTTGRVVENIAAKTVAPVSGVLFQNAA
jgi:hypothetical protein